MMTDFVADVRHALRRALASPGLAALVVATFAIGIGANTAVFSLFDQVLLRSLPVKEPERLVLVDHTRGPVFGALDTSKKVPEPMSYPMFLEFRDKGNVFDGILAYFTANVVLGVDSTTERVQANLVSGTYFDVLGLKPAAGRLLAPADDVTPGAHPLVVVSHSLWTRRFAGDPSVVGRTVRINSVPMQVIGVAPAGFRGLEVGGEPALYLPLTMKKVATPTWDELQSPRWMWLTAVARLEPGMTIAQATAAANVLYKQILAEDLKTITRGTMAERARFLAKDLLLVPGGAGASGFREATEGSFRILLGTSAAVLFIGCLNIANLLLTRATQRKREIALKLAIGGSRTRIIRELVAEGAVLALFGLAAGIGVALIGGRLLVDTLPDPSARQLLSFSLDARVLGFAALLSVLGVMLSTLTPAISATRVDLTPALRAGAGATWVEGRTRQLLVVAQIALSLALLVGAALTTRSLVNLTTRSVGYATERVATFTLDPSLAGFDEAQTHAFLERVESELRSQPAIEDVGMAHTALLNNSTSSASMRFPGYVPADGEDMSSLYLYVNPGFFNALSIPILRGRGFGPGDAEGAPRVAIVNEAFAKRFFKDGDALGKRLGLRTEDGFPFEIVGVVPEFRQLSVSEASGTRQVFIPAAQTKGLGFMAFYVCTRGSEAALADLVASTVRRIDPSIPVSDFNTMTRQRADSIFAERTLAHLASVFGGLALLLASLGLYGVLNHGVAQRFREIGVRVAMGARPGDIVRLILGQAGRLLAGGFALGVPLSIGLVALVRSQLFGVAAVDPLATAAAVLVLGASAIAAASLPAARPSRISSVL
jgi:predicted permease